MKLTTLIENTTNNELSAEHGLAVHIDFNGKQYLLDTGTSNLFLENAEKLNIDLSEVSTAILSHGHFDHSGGFEGFISKNSKAKVFLQTTAKEPYYVKMPMVEKYIGIPEGLLEKYPDRFVFVDGDYPISENVWLISHKTKGLEAIGEKTGLYKKTGSGFAADDFMHEQSLVFDTENGLVILNSCCHGGVVTIVEEVKAMFPGKEILAVVGGFHLMIITDINSMSAKLEDVRDLGKKLLDLNIKHIFTGHCTGLPAFKILQEELGDRLGYLSTGTSFEL